MSKQISSSAALPIAYVLLRILIVLNWLMVPVILVLLFVVPNRQWIMSSFDLSPSPDADRLVMGLRAIAVLGLAAIPLNYVVLKSCSRSLRRFAGATHSRRERGPVAGHRLGAACAEPTQHRDRRNRQAVSSPAHPVDIDAGFSINGWLAVLLTFLLARVFAEGTLMREDLEGTV